MCALERGELIFGGGDGGPDGADGVLDAVDVGEVAGETGGERLEDGFESFALLATLRAERAEHRGELVEAREHGVRGGRDVRAVPGEEIVVGMHRVGDVVAKRRAHVRARWHHESIGKASVRGARGLDARARGAEEEGSRRAAENFGPRRGGARQIFR